MKNTPAGTGTHLKALREGSHVSQPLVAAMAGTSTAYLAKVEDGVMDPTRSYVRKVTEAIIRLMHDPPLPCPILGCDNTQHVSPRPGGRGDPEMHHHDTQTGDGWTVDVQRHDAQDREWVVYAEVLDDYALAPADFHAFSEAYRQAAALAAVLNGRPAPVTP
jgi:hypothetical protein